MKHERYTMRLKTFISTVLFITTGVTLMAQDMGDHLHFKAAEGGIGQGKHVVFLAGDEEYKSEEALPMMAALYAKNGFNTSVLFSLDATGNVDQRAQTSLSNPAALDTADAIVISLRFRNWPAEIFAKFDAALKRGVPIAALRTSTHAFNIKDAKSPYAKYSFNKSIDGWDKGFGREVLGETWVSHHGHHKHQGTRTEVEAANATHAVLTGVGEIFGKTDVYGANPKDPSTILLRGAVTETLDPASKKIDGPKNNPMMPVAWVREYKQADGKINKILTTTMGDATDLSDADLRRLVINGTLWGLGIDIPAEVDVSIDGDYNPTMYGFKNGKTGLKPKDFIVK